MYETEQNIVIGPKKNLFTTVTLVSKILALVLFVVLPFAGFYLGIKYEHSLDITPSTSASAPTKTITDNFQDDSQKTFAND